MHRIATSRKYNDSLAEIMDTWSIADVIDANEVIDALDDAWEAALDE